MDSHGFGVDGIRLRCRTFRAVPTTTSNCSAGFLCAALRSLAVVWNSPHCGRHSGESILPVASPSTNPDYGTRSRGTFSYYDPGRRNICVPGTGRTRYGDLSAFSAWHHANKSREEFSK